MSTFGQRHAGALAVFAIAVTGCHSGGGDSDDTASRPSVAATSYGRMGGVSGLVVNLVTYDTSNVAVTVDGLPGRISDIAMGDVVLVTGMVDAIPARTGVAQTAVLEHAVIGPVDLVDGAHPFIVVLGQQVLFANAIFDPSIPRSSVEGLVVGDIVEVSGFRDQRTQIIASRIAKRAPGTPGFRAAGRIANLDATAERFDINALTVDFSRAAVTPGPAGALVAGDLVEVSGTGVGAAGQLLAERVAFEPTDVVASVGTYAHLEGYVTALDPNQPQRFDVAGFPVATTSATEKDGVIRYDTITEVEGTVSANGALVASTVRTPVTVAVGTHTLSGLVFDAYTGPVPNMPINVWVEIEGWGSVSWWYSTGHGFFTNAAGRFEITGLPDSRVKLWAGGWRDGYFQPCAVTVDMTADVTRDIEVVTADTLNSLSPPRPITARDPTLTGTVYEVTSLGRQPVAGAQLVADGAGGLGLVLANTLTDQSGRYFLCDLGAGLDLGVWKDGYVMKAIYPVGGPPSTTLDIDIEIVKE